MRPEAREIDDLLEDIVEWGTRISDYLKEATLQDFLSDKMVQDATIRCLEVMGEAAGNILRIAPNFQKLHPVLALREAYRARNRTAHGYGSVDLVSIWESARGPAQEMAFAARSVLASRRIL